MTTAAKALLGQAVRQEWGRLKATACRNDAELAHLRVRRLDLMTGRDR